MREDGAKRKLPLLKPDRYMEDKPVKLDYFERRMYKNKPKYRNYWKFQGILPDFSGFESLHCKPAVPITHIPDKRPLLLVLEWLQPDELVLTAALVCRKWYILTWYEELLNSIIFNNFGLASY